MLETDDAALATLYPSMRETIAVQAEARAAEAKPVAATPSAPAAPLDTEAGAAAMFKNTDYTKPPEAAPTPTAEEAEAEKLFAKPAAPEHTVEIPDNIKALRAADAERKMYPATTQSAYVHAVKADDLDGLVEDDDPPEVRAAVAAELREQAVDLGLAVGDVSRLTALAKGIANSDHTPEIEKGWEQEAVKRLLDTNGQNVEKANADLRLAQKLVQRDPRVAEILHRTRLGAHPVVVELFVTRARAEAARGRL